MSEPKITLEQLRSLIGSRVYYQGVDCQIIEVLEGGPTLVLQDCAHDNVIQADQHGEAHRRVAPIFSISVWDKHSGEINPAFLELGLVDF